jgi:hypothetical protein
MRPYSKVAPRYWTGQLSEKLAGDPVGHVVALYLMTCPAGNMIGMFNLRPREIAGAIGLPLRGADTAEGCCTSVEGALAKLEALGFVELDRELGIIWVVKFAGHDTPAPITKPGDPKPAAVRKQLAEINPTSPLYERWLLRWGSHFRVVVPKKNGTPTHTNEGVVVEWGSSGGRVGGYSQDQEQEQKQEQKNKGRAKKGSAAKSKSNKPAEDPVEKPDKSALYAAFATLWEAHPPDARGDFISTRGVYALALEGKPKEGVPPATAEEILEGHKPWVRHWEVAKTDLAYIPQLRNFILRRDWQRVPVQMPAKGGQQQLTPEFLGSESTKRKMMERHFQRGGPRT